MKFKKLMLATVLGVLPIVSQADMTVRERNFAIGGVVLGALAANAMSGPSQGYYNPQPMAYAPSMGYAPSYPQQVYYAPRPMPVYNQCEVRHYRHGYIQDCMPRGQYRVTPPVIGHITPYGMPPPQVNIIYSR